MPLGIKIEDGVFLLKVKIKKPAKKVVSGDGCAVAVLEDGQRER